MLARKSWKRTWLMSLLGLLALVASSGCRTIVTSPDPYLCPPLGQGVLLEYEDAFDRDLYPQWRAWTREADQACRANAAMSGTGD